MSLVATEGQEFLHQPFAHDDSGESYYFNGFDSSRNIGFAIRVGLKPNLQQADSFICLFLPDGQTGFLRQHVTWVPPTDFNALPDIEVGGVRIRCLQPNRQWSVDFNGDIHIYPPHATEQDLFRVLDSPGQNLQSVSLSASFEACSQAVDFESVREKSMQPAAKLLRSILSSFNARSLRHFALAIRSLKMMMQGGHCEQPMLFKAQLQFQGNTELQGMAHRDHSWGVRDARCIRNWKWLSCVFDKDYAVNITQVELLGLRVTAGVLWNG